MLEEFIGAACRAAERFARGYRAWTIASGSSEIVGEVIAQRAPV